MCGQRYCCDLYLVAHLDKKKTIKVALKTPNFLAIFVSSSSILSGIIVQMAMPINESPNAKCIISGLITSVIQAPRAFARP